MKFQIKKFGFLLLFAGITLSLSACFVVRGEPSQKKSTTILLKNNKKPHPHGGPPGQTKKSNGHPGKKHH